MLKLLQIMTEKGLVKRDETARAHVYAAAAPEQQTQQQLVRDLLERAFGGSASKLVMQALSSARKRRRLSWPGSGSCSTASREKAMSD